MKYFSGIKMICGGEKKCINVEGTNDDVKYPF